MNKRKKDQSNENFMRDEITGRRTFDPINKKRLNSLEMDAILMSAVEVIECDCEDAEDDTDYESIDAYKVQ